MFNVGPRKLKCGTEAVQGLTFSFLKSPVPHCFTPTPPPSAESCPAAAEGKGMGLIGKCCLDHPEVSRLSWLEALVLV